MHAYKMNYFEFILIFLKTLALSTLNDLNYRAHNLERECLLCSSMTPIVQPSARLLILFPESFVILHMQKFYGEVYVSHYNAFLVNSYSEFCAQELNTILKIIDQLL